MSGRFRCASVVALALALRPHVARAQQSSVPYLQQNYAQRTWAPVASVSYGAPERLAGELGVARITAQSPNGWAGYVASVEGGAGGARARFGPGALGLSSASFSADVLRTFSHPAAGSPWQTYVGPDLRFVVAFAGGGVGYYWRVTPGGGRARFFAWKVILGW